MFTLHVLLRQITELLWLKVASWHWLRWEGPTGKVLSSGFFADEALTSVTRHPNTTELGIINKVSSVSTALLQTTEPTEARLERQWDPETPSWGGQLHAAGGAGHIQKRYMNTYMCTYCITHFSFHSLLLQPKYTHSMLRMYDTESR